MNNQKKRGSNSQKQPIEFQGKIPPQATDLEEAVLGACMLESGAYNKIGHILNPDYFYKESHQKIFKAIEQLAGRAEPVDILTVTNQLKTEDELELVGGPYAITMLTSRIASTVNIETHAYIIFQKYVQRQMISISSTLINAAYDNDFKEMQSLYINATEELDNLFAGRRADKSMYQVMQEHMKEVDRRIKMAQEGKLTGIKTGLVDLNRVTNGWKPGELIIVAGRPGMGKTAVALNLFTKMSAELGNKTLFFSLEMDDLSLADRLTCSYGGIDAYNLKNGKLSKDEMSTYFESANKIQELPIYIDDTARSDIKHITAISRAKKRKGECDMIIIDYLQLIESHNDSSWQKNREREVAEMSRSLKLLAKELKVPVMLLAQLSREVERRTTTNKRPQLSDLRESGAIEQDADMVIFPYRPEYYGIIEDDEGNSTEGVMILVIAKNRNGKIGDIYAKYSEDLTRFFDYNSQSEPF